MNTILKIALYIGLIYVIPFVVPGVAVDSLWPTAVIAGVVFFLFNTILKPILKVLAFPITLLTLGLFSLVINAAVFWGTAYFVTGFTVADFWAALIGGLLAAIGGWIINGLLDKKDED